MPDKTQGALTQVLVAQYRSLAMYLQSAAPWAHPGDDRAASTLSHIVADQTALCARIADYIIDRFGRLETGDFPMEFTGLNDCSLDYMVRELISSEKGIITAIESSLGALVLDSAALALGEESLGAARGHLESLQELLPQPVK